MAQNRNITVRLLADASQYEATMAKAGTKTETLATGMEKTGSKTGLITTGLTTAGLAVAAFGVAAVKTAADFDQQMSTVQANTQASSSQLDQLRAAAITAGADTVFSASEAADGINELGKAGLSTTDILSGGLSGALDLAAADGMQVGQAAELMSTTLKQFNLTGQDATKVADALAAGAGKAVGSAADLGQALNQSGLMAHGMGISMQETVGTLSAFANAGLIGSDAGTSLKTMLQRLQNPTKQASDEMNDLGLRAYDAQGNFVGLQDFAGQLKGSLSNLSQEQRNAALSTIFGADAIRAATVLYEQGSEGIGEWTKDVSESGYAADMAAAKNNNLKGDVENLSGSFESLLIKVGEGGQGPLRSLVQTVDALVDGFSGLPAPVQQGIVLAGSLVGVMGGLHKVMTPLNTSTSAFSQSLGLALDPMGRLSSALPQLKSGFGDLGSVLGTSMSALSTGTPVIGRGAAAMSGLKSIAGGVVSLMGGPWGIAFAIAGASLLAWVKKAQQAKQNADAIKNAFETTGDASKTLVDQVMDTDWSWLDKLHTGFGNLPDAIKGAGVSVADFVSAAEGSQPALDKVNKAIDTLYNKESGYGQSAEAAKKLRGALNDLSGSYDKGSQSAKDAKEASDQLDKTNAKTTGSTKDNADALKEQEEAAKQSSDAIDDLIKSLFGLESQNLGADQAVTGMNQKILDLSDTIRENGRVLDENGNALQGHEQKAYDTQSSLQTLADSAQNAAVKILQEGQATGDMDGASQRAAATLENARQAFVNNATASGMSKDAAERLADAYGLQKGKVDVLKSAIDNLPSNHNTNVTANTSQATDAINGLNSMEIADKWFTIHGTYVDESGGRYSSSGYRPKGATGNIPTGATGGRFTGTEFLPGYADGGTVSGLMRGPGTGTSDSIWLANARVANGEYVTKQDSVDYYGTGLFDDLNNQRIPRELFAKAPQTPQVIIMQQPQEQAPLKVEMSGPIMVPTNADIELASQRIGFRVATAIRSRR